MVQLISFVPTLAWAEGQVPFQQAPRTTVDQYPRGRQTDGGRTRVAPDPRRPTHARRGGPQSRRAHAGALFAVATRLPRVCVLLLAGHAPRLRQRRAWAHRREPRRQLDG